MIVRPVAPTPTTVVTVNGSAVEPVPPIGDWLIDVNVVYVPIEPLAEPPWPAMSGAYSVSATTRKVP